MIFVDSNVPMYLVGADHPRKTDAQRLLERHISDRARLVTDAEIFQEMLHRYVAINRRDAIQPTFEVTSRRHHPKVLEFGVDDWKLKG